MAWKALPSVIQVRRLEKGMDTHKYGVSADRVIFDNIEDIGLFCPLMGKPCMGKLCACAVHERLCGQLVWWCGLVPGSSDNAALSPIDKED